MKLPLRHDLCIHLSDDAGMHPPSVRSTGWRSLALLLLGSLLACPQARAATDTGDAFDITVRSSVERPYSLFGKKPAVEHSKLYVIGGIKAAYLMPHDTSQPLAVPVDEDELRAELKAVLSAHGFHEITWGKTADIVLTIIYGRNQLVNPYADKTVEVDGGAIGLPGARVVSANSDQIQREKADPEFYEKMQKANNEKLFIAITAWKNPGFNPKEKPVQLWRTVVFVDDPDRNLNTIADKMLAAAGTYFDHAIDKEEISVLSTALTGNVEVGTPVEVEPKTGN
jgi:hypothetical protein